MPRRNGAAVPALGKLLGRISATGEDIPLCVTATAMMLLGGWDGMADQFLATLATHDDPVYVLEQVWKAGIAGAPWLDGFMTPLIGWMEGASPERAALVREVARAYHDVNFKEFQASPPFEGDLLGPLYTSLRSEHSKKRGGAFYTPMTVCKFMGAMVGPSKEGESILDPCCGSGGLLLGAAWALRDKKQKPSSCIWVANDIDPMAVALCGVNLTAHNCGPHIWLSVGNGLMVGSGHEEDPHLTQRPWWERKEVLDGGTAGIAG